MKSVMIASKIHEGATWLPRFLCQIEQLDIPDSRVVFMYGKSQDASFSLLDHYRNISRHTVEIYADPYIPPEEKHGAMLTRVKQEIQRLLAKGGEDYYFNIDCDIVKIPPETIKQLMSRQKDLIASMVWTEGTPYRKFFDTYEFRMNNCRFHPFNPPGSNGGEPFKVDSVSTCYLATAEAELAGKYSNPYPHIPFCADLIKKGYEIWVDPESNVYHYDLERVGIGRAPLPIRLSAAPFIDVKGNVVQIPVVAAQAFHIKMLEYQNWLQQNSSADYLAEKAFLDTRPLITASYKIFNDADFIEYSLKSVYPYVDKIDIVEGAVKLRKGDIGEQSEATVEKLKTFPDPDNKIRLIRGNWSSKEEIQQKLLEICTSRWMLFIDADEILTSDSMQTVRSWCETNKEGQKMYARPERFLHYFHDFYHIAYSTNPISPWAQFGVPHPFLIWRDIPGLNFNTFHTVPRDGFGTFIHSDSPEYSGRREVLDGVTVYHFGNAKSDEDMIQKLTFERERGLNWDCDEKGEKVPVSENFYFTGKLPSDMVVEMAVPPKILEGHPRYLEQKIKFRKGKDGYTFKKVTANE